MYAYGICIGTGEEPLHLITKENSCYQWRVVKKYPAIKIRCGIHTGNVFVGNLGKYSNIFLFVFLIDNYCRGSESYEIWDNGGWGESCE